MFFSEFTDGTFLVSSSGKPDMAAPKTIMMNRMYRASLHDLWNTHIQKLETLSHQKNVVPIWTVDEVKASAEREHILLRDFHIARGVFRERSAAEAEKAEAFRSRVEEAQSQGLEHGEVLAELDRMQDNKPSWSGAIWILVLSAVAFLAAGAKQWNWKFTVLLLPILFFHEAGHWLAMRIFGYRNLRMFFIPLFGAAVTGRNWNVAGWKKALVSLAGPLPGILLGVALGIVSLFVKKPLLIEASLLLILVNAFNLVPILPLDGGHVLHATLFCRNRWLDVTFRLLAILGLIALGIFGHLRFLPYLAIVMAISLPVAFKIGKVTDEMRKQALPPPFPGQDRIPTQTAQSIISAVKAALPKGSSTKTIATHSIGVFETLNARPPGFLATSGILVLHGGTILVSIVVATLLILQKSGGLGDFFKAAIRQPQHSIACGKMRTFDKAGGLSNSGVNTIVTTFGHSADAETAFGSMMNRIPESARLVLYGDSLLLALPADDDVARERWFDEFQSHSTNAFVALTNRPVSLSLTFIAPTEVAATNLEEQMKEYFNPGGMYHLIAPWSPDATKPEFAKFSRARRDWMRISDVTSSIWKNPALAVLDRKITAAFKRGSAAESERLGKEQEKVVKELQAKAVDALRAPGSDGVDATLIDLYSSLEATPYTNRIERTRLQHAVAVQLGTVESKEDGIDQNKDAYGTLTGTVARHGLLMEVHWASFPNPAVGLPAFTEWLCNQHCAGMKYDLSTGFSFPDLDDLQD
jgi:Zn-dependent protease